MSPSLKPGASNGRAAAVPVRDETSDAPDRASFLLRLLRRAPDERAQLPRDDPHQRPEQGLTGEIDGTGGDRRKLLDRIVPQFEREIEIAPRPHERGRDQQNRRDQKVRAGNRRRRRQRSDPRLKREIAGRVEHAEAERGDESRQRQQAARLAATVSQIVAISVSARARGASGGSAFPCRDFAPLSSKLRRAPDQQARQEGRRHAAIG